MARQARIVLPGVAHHVTQRGNNRQDVFFVDDDRRVYLSYLRESAARYGLAVAAYCLKLNELNGDSNRLFAFSVVLLKCLAWVSWGRGA